MGFYDQHLKMSASQRPLVEVRETGFLVCEQNLVVMTFMKKIEIFPCALHLVNSILVTYIHPP